MFSWKFQVSLKTKNKLSKMKTLKEKESTLVLLFLTEIWKENEKNICCNFYFYNSYKY